jgi:hypothetical protein
MPRKIFGPKRDRVAGDWSKLQNKELHDLYSSPNIIWVVKSRRMRWARYMAHMGEKKMYTGVWLEILKELKYLEDLCIDGDSIRMDL